jgi:hypothetical protein
MRKHLRASGKILPQVRAQVSEGRYQSAATATATGTTATATKNSTAAASGAAKSFASGTAPAASERSKTGQRHAAGDGQH